MRCKKTEDRRQMTEGKRQNKGFTIIEILTVLAVMAILVGVLLPALTTARNAARQAKQRVQFVAIEQALLAFRNDYGDYPPSDDTVVGGTRLYCGSQKLAEAMLGLDLLGFYPKSLFDADQTVYNDNQTGRKPRYLELETANAFFLGDHFDTTLNQNLYGLFTTAELNLTSPPMVPYGYVLCDVFWDRSVNIGGKSVKAGMPILYYKANPSGDGLHVTNIKNATYDPFNNLILLNLVNSVNSPYQKKTLTPTDFLKKITDPKVTQSAYPWPYKPDSYILISAGIDGLYGTADDITNFGY